MTQHISLLVVDDESTDRYILIRHLKSSGLPFDVVEAVDGREALEFLDDFDHNKSQHGDNFPPAAVFLDINMPRFDGFEFLDAFEKLRASRDEYATCAVMICSSSDQQADRDRAFKKSFVKGYIIKGETEPDEIKRRLLSAIAAMA